MKLNRLTLTNFKGIKSFTLDTQGEDVNVYGDNATGKTTLADSFMWLLFDKDSANRKDFDIKTLDESGEPFHGLDHSVEGVFDIAGKELTLKKVYAEKWTKKRGSATKEFTGHTVDHFVNGVPVKKGEYEARIADIIDEDTFKLLTNPKFFNEHLHWQKRRELLLEVCGDISDEEVIASDKALSGLPAILGDRKLEDHRKVIAARRAEINKELGKIPVRIDEVERGLPRIDGIANEKELPNDIAKLHEQLRTKQGELAQASAGGAVAELIKKLRLIEGQMLEEKNRMTGEATERAEQKNRELWRVNDSISKVKSGIDYHELKAKSTEVEIKNLEEKMEILRAEWHTENNKVFEYKQSDTCPTCGQSLPQEQLETARVKALAEFNRTKANKLESISAEGKRLVERKAELEKELADISQGLNELSAQLPELEQKKTALRDEIHAIQNGLRQIEPSPKYIQLQKKCEDLEEQIKQAQADTSVAVAEIQKEIDTLSEAIKALEQAAARLEAHKNGLKRIEELKAEERRLAAEFEELEQQLYLTEEFIRSKVQLLEGKINSRFQMARFKLFDVQINGAVAETAETMYNGVPYSNLNNGAKVQVGLDIIRTLQCHYGLSCPVWIDNRESIVRLPEMDCQVISLIVSEKDKKLRIELAEREEFKREVMKLHERSVR